MNTEYTSVTEMTGYRVTSEQLQRMYTRYHFASDFCEGKDVLEVACGTGQGLGYLAKKARRVVAGDYDPTITEYAKDYYKERIDIRQLDAHHLPFENQSFDVVILFEAIYYLSQPEKFAAEARRVLRKGGVLLISTANKNWSGFNPSPYSHRYFSAPELSQVLQSNGFDHVSVYGDCLVKTETPKAKFISVIKKAAVSLHLIPKTMKGKELLKRIFMGKLAALPPEVQDGMAENIPPVSIPPEAPNGNYKVLLALAHK